MKILIIAIFALVALAGCGGGGGGGNSPSVETPEPPSELQPITQAEQAQARQEAAALRAEAQGIANAELLRRIAQLESDINAAQQTLAELRREIARLRADLTAPTPDPVVCTGANEVGNEPNCACVVGYERKGGVCTKISDPKPPVMVLPECTDFRVRNAAGVCTYDTPEYRNAEHLGQVNALYAYERGYHGQDITIAMMDSGSPRLNHVGLIGQVVNSLHADRPSATDNHPNNWHATFVGGVIAGLRRGSEDGGHGVAPGAKLISFGGAGSSLYSQFQARVQYFVDNTIQIVNNVVGSSGVHLRGQFRGERVIVPFLPSGGDGFWRKDRFSPTSEDIANIAYQPAENADIVFVVAAGNDGWQGPQSTLSYARCTDQTEGGECPFGRGTEVLKLTLSDVLSEFVDEEYGVLNTLDISPFGTTRRNNFPLFNTLLVDNWIAVIALDGDEKIASFSNACGAAMNYCMAAPGVDILSPHGGYTDRYGTPDGTSFSAPIVSGALAVLKNAADDLHSGTEMTLMTNVRLILLETATDLGDPGVDEVYGWGLVNISAGITHLQGIAGQMAAIKNSQIPRLGGAAAAANGGKFAAAAGEGAFRFWGGLENRDKWAGLATAEYGGISAFGEVGNSALEINSFLANGEVQNAESESWTAGIQRGNIWRHNDNLQISARQESRLNDGELVLQYSFGKQIRIPIKQKPATIWTAAYSQESDDGKWTAAMEWNALTDAKGFSFAAEIDL